MTISVVATYHAAKGLVTPQALLGILESIAPEVIFLECPEASFADFQDGTIQTLESIAVRLYCERYTPALVPVDAPTPPSDFWRGNENLFMRVERVSADYRRLHDAHMSAVAQGGFPFLNSDRGSEAQTAVDEELLASVEWTNNTELLALYKTWRAINDSREDTMLSRISAYARHHQFGEAVFLIGAAHRSSLIRKTSSGTSSLLPSSHWDFNRFQHPEGAA